MVSVKMVYHNIQVRSGDILLPPWLVDEDRSFFHELYCWISEELTTPTSNPHTRYSIDAIIRGGEVIMQVHDDKSLMAMFSINSNAEDVIVLDVTPIIYEPLQVRYPSENEEVNEDEDEEDDDEEDVDEVDLEDVDEVEGGVSVNSSDESQDESLDPEWKNGQDYSSENVSSESIGDMLTTSDDEGSNDDGETALSGEEYDETFRRPRRYGDERHPNSNILRVPNPINDGGRIVLRQWQSFGDFRSFNAILKDYYIQEGGSRSKRRSMRGRG